MLRSYSRLLFLFFNETATTEIYTLSLHDALPIYAQGIFVIRFIWLDAPLTPQRPSIAFMIEPHGRHQLLLRSEEHTSELQSRPQLVCRLLPAKKKNRTATDKTQNPECRYREYLPS